MPPKGKAALDKKNPVNVVRPPISTSSLLYMPNDILPGFDMRMETAVPWTAKEVGFRQHAAKCRHKDLPVITFRKAFIDKINQSPLGNFLQENSPLTMEEQLELLPLSEWDTERFGTDEAKICFQKNNNLTDNLLRIIKEAVKTGNRKFLKERLKRVTTLRMIDSKMTELDETISELDELIVLNFCGNYLEVVDAACLPASLRVLELQSNRITRLDFACDLPTRLVYLGLARNFLQQDCGLDMLRFSSIAVLDLSDNDIYNLEPTAEALFEMLHLNSLALAGNPCSMCIGYAYYLLEKLPRLIWLDWREVLLTDRPPPPDPEAPAQASAAQPPTKTVHPDDLRSAYFVFTCYRIMSAPQPPKPEKGCTMAFHLEIELPLLDATRRQFLMYRQPSSLVELMPEPEDDISPALSSKTKKRGKKRSSTSIQMSTIIPVTAPASKESALEESHEEDIFSKLTTKNPREIIHYTVFESAHIPWAMIMNFQEPTIKIFCPDLTALRNTFRTDITVRLVFTMSSAKGGGAAGGGAGRKSTAPAPGGPTAVPGEQYCVVCSVVCGLKSPDWSQNMQDFHWDDSLPDNRAIHWGDGDLSVLQYNPPTAKPVKAKAKADTAAEPEVNPLRQTPPENLTCHFGFGIETLKRQP